MRRFSSSAMNVPVIMRAFTCLSKLSTYLLPVIVPEDSYSDYGQGYIDDYGYGATSKYDSGYSGYSGASYGYSGASYGGAPDYSYGYDPAPVRQKIGPA